MTTLLEILENVKRDLGDADGIAWSDEELVGWINDAVKDIARRTESVQKTWSDLVYAGTEVFDSMPADFAVLNRLEWRDYDDGRVTRLEVRNINDMDSLWRSSRGMRSGVPRVAGVYGIGSSYCSVALWPVPAEDGILDIYYAAIPEPLDPVHDLSTDLEIPNGWDDLVVEYAVYRARRRDRDANWQDAKVAYEESLAAMLAATEAAHREHGMIHDITNLGEPWLFGEM